MSFRGSAFDITPFHSRDQGMSSNHVAKSIPWPFRNLKCLWPIGISAYSTDEATSDSFGVFQHFVIFDETQFRCSMKM